MVGFPNPLKSSSSKKQTKKTGQKPKQKANDKSKRPGKAAGSKGALRDNAVSPLLDKFFRVEYLKNRKVVIESNDGTTWMTTVTFTPMNSNGLMWDKTQNMDLNSFGAWAAERAHTKMAIDRQTGWENFMTKLKSRIQISGLEKPEIVGKQAFLIVNAYLSPAEKQVLDTSQKVYSGFAQGKINDHLRASDMEHPIVNRVPLINKALSGESFIPPVWVKEGTGLLRSAFLKDKLSGIESESSTMKNAKAAKESQTQVTAADVSAALDSSIAA